jgi:hypothetical protein
MWIRTDDIGCCPEWIGRFIYIGKVVTGSIHDQFEGLCDLEEMIEDDFMT